LIACLVAPAEDAAGKANSREGSHLKLRDNRDSFTAPWNDHGKWPFHLVKILSEDTTEIGTGHQHKGVQSGLGKNGGKGLEHGSPISGGELENDC
jgi:hypothetical protein